MNNLKSFLGVVLLNALLAFPVAYLVYKHYNPVLTPMDMDTFMDMARNGIASLEPPFRYRWVTAFLVRGMEFLPGYDIPIVFSADPSIKSEFFHFVLLNFTLTILTSGMLFLYLRNTLRPGFAYLGSVLYLFSFYTVIVNLVPMSDAACHLAVISCVLAMEKRKPFWFALAFLIGVFAKETIVFVVPAWVMARSLADRRNLLYLVWLLPAMAVYFAATRLSPSASSQLYYQIPFLIRHSVDAFNPFHYDRSLLFHTFLSQAPLLVALAVFAYLKLSRKGGDVALNRELYVVLFLVWVGGTTGLGNNTGRCLFLAFPAIVYFEAMVVQAVALRLGFTRQGVVD